jgi:hypothetical protein
MNLFFTAILEALDIDMGNEEQVNRRPWMKIISIDEK